MQHTNWKPIANLADDVRSGRSSATELVQKSLSAMRAAKEYGAILETIEEASLRRAAAIDEDVKQDKKTGRLAGVPFIAKDNYLTFNSETTAASNMLKGFHAPYQATVIEKLEAEGAILVGKANLDAFAHGASTENSDSMVTKNPFDLTRVAGGSSGGSAVATALGLAPFALGSDTGGSIRQPAGFSGVIGLKPTYGLVSRYGVVAMASSTDCMGPLTTTAEDAALVLDVMAGRDPLDATTIDRPDTSFVDLDSDVSKLRVGVIKQQLGDGVQDGVRSRTKAAIELLKSRGATIKEVSLPSLEKALACYYIIVPAEVSSNLSRYDGIRFGFSSQDAINLNELYEESRSAGFNSENKRRIMIGTYVLSSGYYDAYYKKAQAVRTVIINEFNKVMEEVDVLLGPTSPTTAFKIGENTEDPLQMYLADVMTVGYNLIGCPAVSVPFGMADNLPVGVQIAAAPRQDKLILRVAKALEQPA